MLGHDHRAVTPPRRATGIVMDQGSRPRDTSKAALRLLLDWRRSLEPETEETSLPPMPESTATIPG
ncbi:hypothetical protein [Brevundimonas denitrificans]|uniref:hypothetical protein n=1 Tax=Brevundimonas denitrificans TaxID=1443434 RepID=UPI00223B69DA|nr:hypothetical protein [Brevundimonas denitrificans]